MGCSSGGELGCASAVILTITQDYRHGVAAGARFVGDHRAEVQNDACSAVCLCRQNCIQGAHIDITTSGREAERGISQIKRYARRIINRERKRLGSRSAHDQFQFHPVAGQALDLNVLQPVTFLCICGRSHKQQECDLC